MNAIIEFWDEFEKDGMYVVYGKNLQTKKISHISYSKQCYEDFKRHPGMNILEIAVSSIVSTLIGSGQYE